MAGEKLAGEILSIKTVISLQSATIEKQLPGIRSPSPPPPSLRVSRCVSEDGDVTTWARRVAVFQRATFAIFPRWKGKRSQEMYRRVVNKSCRGISYGDARRDNGWLGRRNFWIYDGNLTGIVGATKLAFAHDQETLHGSKD